jgi:hypothetical protein
MVNGSEVTQEKMESFPTIYHIMVHASWNYGVQCFRGVAPVVEAAGAKGACKKLQARQQRSRLADTYRCAAKGPEEDAAYGGVSIG